MTQRSIMFCGHGSRDANAVRELKELVEKIRLALPDDRVNYGFLEFARPILREGLDELVQAGGSGAGAGARSILAIPGMLFAAGHAKNDIPSVLNRYQAERGVSIRYGRELGCSLPLLRVARERIQSALEGLAEKPLAETLLVVVGRGASDPDANANVAKVTRMLWEGMGFGYALTAYSGVTFPMVKPGLRLAARLGFQRVVVFPYFLFTGILIKRIYDHTDAVAAEYPHMTFVKAGYLGSHKLVVQSFLERINEIETGQNAMNCQLCKYREAFIGFEHEVGQVQASHHHHVEGGAHPHTHPHTHMPHAHTHAETHAHTETHEHAIHGHHAPYPFADHPLGPRGSKASA